MLLTSIGFLTALMLFLNGRNYLLRLNRLSALANGTGRKVSKEGLYFSIAALEGRNKKKLIQTAQTGKLLSWSEVLDLQTEQLLEQQSHPAWFLVVRTKTDAHDYMLRFDALEASQEEIIESIKRYHRTT